MPKIISIKNGQQIALALLIPINTYISIHYISTISDMGLEDNPNLQFIALKDLLNKFSDIFTSHNYNFEKMVDIIYSINIGNSKPFKFYPYQKLIIEEQIVFKELKNLLDASLLQLSKSP